MPATHPTDLELDHFLLGKLPDLEFAAVEDHLADCDECRDRAATAPAADTLTELLAAARTRIDAERSAAPTPTLTGSATPSLFAATGAWHGTSDDSPPPALAEHPKYRVLRRLGVGGMGTVWLAEHAVMNRPVAVKVIRPDLLAKAGASERFLREVRAAAKLHHPNIVTAYDAEPAGDSCLLVMEYVPGETLADRVKAGPLTAREACRAVRDAARGLAHAHAAGLVHRDVKPHNLMRAADGTVKVLDFGLAAVVAGEAIAAGGDGLTGTGMVAGTPDYIAPEQITAPHAADARADVYGLGCTLYHLLAGRVPFPDGTVTEKLAAHQNRAPEPIPGLTPGLAAVLAKMMAKRPEDRYQTAEELLAALEPFTGELPPARRRRSCADHPWATAAALFFAVVVVVGAGVYKIQRDNQEIVIQTDDPDIEVVMKRKGQLVRVLDRKTGQEWVIDTESNQIGLTDLPEGLKLQLPDNGEVVLRRKGEKVFSVTRVPRPAAVGKASLIHDLPWPGAKDANVFDATVSPDGRYVLAASEGQGKTLTAVWDRETGKLLSTFPAFPGAVFLPDGRHVLAPGHGLRLVVWDVTTGQKAREFPGHKAWPRLSVSADGARAVSCPQWGIDAPLVLWDVTAAKPIAEWKPGHDEGFTAELSPDGKRVVTVGRKDRTVRLWDAAEKKEINSWESKEREVYGPITFEPDGQAFVIAAEGGVARFAVGSSPFRWVWSNGLESSEAVSPGGRLALLCDRESTVRLYDLETGRTTDRVVLPGRVKGRMGLSADGRYGAASVRTDGPARVYVFRLTDAPGEKAGEVRRIDWRPRHAYFTTFSPDGRYYLATGEGEWAETRVWEVVSGKPVLTFAGNECAAFTPDGQSILAAGPDKALHLWELATGKEVRRFPGHTDWVGDLAVSPDGKRAISGGADATVRVWDLTTGQELKQLTIGTRFARALFSPDGSHILTYDGGSDRKCPVRLWDANTFREVRTWQHPGNAWVKFQPDGRGIVTVTRGGVVEWWDVNADKPVRSLMLPPREVYGAGLSVDCRRLVYSSVTTKSAHLVDLTSGKELVVLNSLPKGGAAPEWGLFPYGTLAVSPDGRYAAGASSGGWVYLWRLPEPAAAEDDEARIQGAWRPVSGEHAARTLTADELKGIRADVRGDSLVLALRLGNESYHLGGSFSLDPREQPRRMTYIVQTRRTTADKAKPAATNGAVHGIYRFDGDQLVWCFTEGADRRPAEFTTSPQTPDQFLLTLERQGGAATTAPASKE